MKKEKLIIKNFSVIDDTELNVNKVNILIGPQSTGKSIIAKLVYFFRTVHQGISSNIFNDGGKRKLNEELRFRFNGIFPEYLILARPFEVTYYYGESFISISGKGAKSFKSFKLTYSKGILKEIKVLKDKYLKEIASQVMNGPLSPDSIRLSISDELFRFLHGVPKPIAAFIPAGRSFFVNIEKTIFTLQTKSTPIDRMLIDFGSFLEIAKGRFKPSLPRKEYGFDETLYRECIEVLGGEYKYSNNNDYLKRKDNKEILLMDSSSGQQAAAPLIISLLALSKMAGYQVHMSIEEPEAHLFPESQRSIVEIIAIVYNILNRNSVFFITTHSPYILTALNNLIQAENTSGDIGDQLTGGKITEERESVLRAKLDKLISIKKRVAFDDVTVYSVKNGSCTDIRDEENKLISADEIDGVSDSIGGLYDQMLDISFGE